MMVQTEARKAWNEANRERLNEKAREHYKKDRSKAVRYREANKEKIAKYQKKYSDEHKEELIVYHKEYYKKNSKELIEYQHKYQAENREMILAKGRAYNLKRKRRKCAVEVVNE